MKKDSDKYQFDGGDQLFSNEHLMSTRNYNNQYDEENTYAFSNQRNGTSQVGVAKRNTHDSNIGLEIPTSSYSQQQFYDAYDEQSSESRPNDHFQVSNFSDRYSNHEQRDIRHVSPTYGNQNVEEQFSPYEEEMYGDGNIGTQVHAQSLQPTAHQQQFIQENNDNNSRKNGQQQRQEYHQSPYGQQHQQQQHQQQQQSYGSSYSQLQYGQQHRPGHQSGLYGGHHHQQQNHYGGQQQRRYGSGEHFSPRSQMIHPPGAYAHGHHKGYFPSPSMAPPAPPRVKVSQNAHRHAAVSNIRSSAAHIPRRALPFPPIVNESTPVFMIQFKMEFRYFVSSPFMTEFIGLNYFAIVECEKGEDIGLVVEIISMEEYLIRRKKEEKSGQFEEEERVLRHILKVANQTDTALLPEKFHDETIVVQHSNEVVTKMLKLPMRIVTAEYQFDRAKLVFYYDANVRVDFRDLISKLFSIFKTRVWLKQINNNLIFDPPAYTVMALRTGVVNVPSQNKSPPSRLQLQSPHSSVHSSDGSDRSVPLRPTAVMIPTAPAAVVEFSEEDVLADYVPSDDEDEEAAQNDLILQMKQKMIMEKLQHQQQQQVMSPNSNHDGIRPQQQPSQQLQHQQQHLQQRSPTAYYPSTLQIVSPYSPDVSDSD